MPTKVMARIMPEMSISSFMTKGSFIRYFSAKRKKSAQRRATAYYAQNPPTHNIWPRQAALVKSRDNSGNSYNIRAKGCIFQTLQVSYISLS
jgi:hypothetical protein